MIAENAPFHPQQQVLADFNRAVEVSVTQTLRALLAARDLNHAAALEFITAVMAQSSASVALGLGMDGEEFETVAREAFDRALGISSSVTR